NTRCRSAMATACVRLAAPSLRIKDPKWASSGVTVRAQGRFSSFWPLFTRSGLWQTGPVKTSLPASRGYFAIGVEGVSKAVNLGNLMRSAHAFGANFVFTVGADEKAVELHHDTSTASAHM